MLNYIILGIVQGLTEFLPVSSSAHLVIMQKLLGMSGNELTVSVILHLGTAFALIIFFFKDILELRRNIKLLLLIIIVTVITGFIGVWGKVFVEPLFSSLKAVGIALMITGIILIFTRKFMQAKRNKLSLKDALLLGLVQGIAVIPGISRSGTTISTLLFRNIEREVAFKFSCLASIPAVFGAAILEIKDVGFAFRGDLKALLAGSFFSLAAGILSLWILRIVLVRARLYYFGYYCIIVAVVVLLFK